MKRDPVNLAQLALFEPEASEALQIMQHQQRRFEALLDSAEMWAACWCPGAQLEALRQADEAFEAWKHAAFFLDFLREAGL